MANFNKNKKYHFIYKTTNLINGTFYIGMHSTSNLKDGYLGSGKRLLRSIKKYGEKNFSIETLEFLPDRDSLVKREKEIVNEELIKDILCMNLKPGGRGGFCNDIHKEKFLEGRKWGRILGGINAQRKIRSNPKLVKLRALKSSLSLKKYFKTRPGHWKNRKHSLVTIEQMKNTRKGTGIKETNSQYGSFWITNGIENKKIKTNESIPNGWYKGRIIK